MLPELRWVSIRYSYSFPFPQVHEINNFCRPVLVTMSSFRLIAGFLISFKSADWILDIGFIKTFSIYSGIMMLFTLMLPLVFYYGKPMRLWSAGKLGEKPEEDDGKSMKSIEMDWQQGRKN